MATDLPKHDGVSLLPQLRDPKTRLARKTLYWHYPHYYTRMSPGSAVRDGDWKLVRTGHTGNPARLKPWELYDMRSDRSELHNVAAQHPERVAELSAKWDAWATRALIRPFPWKFEDEE